MRFTYNPFSRSSSKLQVSNESLRWLLKGLLASPLIALLLQVSVTDHRTVESTGIGERMRPRKNNGDGKGKAERRSSEHGSSGWDHQTSTSNWLPSNRWCFSPLASPGLWAWQEPLSTSICRFPVYLLQRPWKTHTEPFSWQCTQFGDHFSILYIRAALFGNAEGTVAKKHQPPNSRKQPN